MDPFLSNSLPTTPQNSLQAMPGLTAVRAEESASSGPQRGQVRGLHSPAACTAGTREAALRKPTRDEAGAYLQDIELGRLNFGPCLLQPRHGTEVHASCRGQQAGSGRGGVTRKLGGKPQAQTLTDDGHHGVEVPDVEALPGHVNEEL